jgi:hypothetical protein
MSLTKHLTLLVCLVFLVAIFATEAAAWQYQQAAYTDRQEDLAAPLTLQPKAIQKVKPPKHIVKCRPEAYAGRQAGVPYEFSVPNILPVTQHRGWKFDAEVLFARTKGTVRFLTGYQSAYTYGTSGDVDLNGDMGIPEHAVVPTFTAQYRFRPQWGVRYSITPLAQDGSGTVSSNFVFGTTTFNNSQNTRVKRESLYQRIGLVYDPIRTYTSRVSVFGDYVRINDKISATQGFGGSATMDNDLNMAMAGLEFERCLKTTRTNNTLSLECRAGIAFLDEAVGSDLSTGLKYSIPLNNGRWGFVSGGYRYLNYKKKYSDAKSFDTAMEGGYLQMGFIF